MKRKRFSEEQIIAVLREHDAGAKAADLARKYGVSEATLYNWKAKYGGMAWANITYTANTADSQYLCGGGDGCSFPASFNNTKMGWALGAGYETMITANWTLRAEYLFYTFGGTTVSADPSPAANCFGGCTATYAFPDLNIHTARAGINYRF